MRRRAEAAPLRPSLRLLSGLGAILAFGAAAWFPGARPASAQVIAPQVGVRLVSQSAWNSVRHPLDLSFEATNAGTTTLSDLVVTLAIDAPARSRSVYQLSLHTDATATLVGFAFVETGGLAPGQTRTFAIHERLDALAGLGESLLYPLRIQLLSHDAPVATLRTPMVFLVERPVVPMELAWTWVLSDPLQYQPNGVFRPGPLEADIAAGGRLDVTIEALAASDAPADVALSPSLVDQLRRMSRGYRIQESIGGIRTVPRGTAGAADAVRILDALRAIVSRPGVITDAMPFGDASFPALLTGDLDAAPHTLLDRGASLIHHELGIDPSRTVVRPPSSMLDRPSLAKLAELGYRVALVDPGFVAQPLQPNGFSPSPVTRLTDHAASLAAVLPDPAVESVASATPGDPVLAAHAALGELAAIWFELPGTPGRGAAMLFPEEPSQSPAFMASFAALVPRSPWLQPVSASTLASTVTAITRQPVPRRRYPGFSPGYVPALQQARAELGQFGETAQAALSVESRLRDDLLSAESGAFVSDPGSGRAFISAVRRTILGAYRRIEVSYPVAFTLASQRGVIPVTLSNRSGFAMRVRVRLVADRRLRFPAGNPRIVTLGAHPDSFTFPVRAETTGRIPLTIEVLTPVRSGVPDQIAQIQTVVRSTAYNRVALVLTIGAAVFLLAWWGRRFLPRRSS